MADEVIIDNQATEDDVQWLEKRLDAQDKVLSSLAPILEKISQQLDSNQSKPITLTDDQMDTLRTLVEISGNRVNGTTQTRLEALLERLEKNNPESRETRPPDTSIQPEPRNNPASSGNTPNEPSPEPAPKKKQSPVRSFKAI